MSKLAAEGQVVSARTVRSVAKIDNGRTLAIELETGSGDPLFVLLPTSIAAGLAAQIIENVTREPRNSN